MRRVGVLVGAWLAIVALVAGAGCGDICDADLGSAEGRWEFTITAEDGDQFVTKIDIDSDGNVEVDTGSNGDDWDCDVDQDDFCDLKVSCDEVGGTGSFEFRLENTG